MTRLKKELMGRGMSSDQADAKIKEAQVELKKRIANPSMTNDPDMVCQEILEIEDEYVLDLMDRDFLKM